MVKGSGSGLLAAARELGAPIARVVVTHAHDDHNGSLDALAAELPGAEVVFSAREARLMAGDRTMDSDERPKPPRFATTSTPPTRTVGPGDRIGSLEVHDARGHTPGQIALLDTRDGTLICADSFTTLNGGLATTARPYWRFPFRASSPGTGRPSSRPAGRCARSSPPRSRRDTGRSYAIPGRRWTARSPARRADSPRGLPPGPAPRRGRQRERARRWRALGYLVAVRRPQPQPVLLPQLEHV